MVSKFIANIKLSIRRFKYVNIRNLHNNKAKKIEAPSHKTPK